MSAPEQPTSSPISLGICARLRRSRWKYGLFVGGDAIVHLAAIAYVPQANREPDLAYEVNVQGTRSLLLASQAKQAERDVQLLFREEYSWNALAQTFEARSDHPRW